MNIITKRFLLSFLSVVLLNAVACNSSVNYNPPADSTEMAITHYSFGLMTIDGKNYSGDLSILPSGKIKPWIINRGTHVIEPDDVAPFINKNTKAVIIGTGSSGACKLSYDLRKLLDDLQKRNVHIFVDNTPAAVMHFNAISKEGLLACFHLNC